MLVTLKDIKKMYGGDVLFEGLHLDILPQDKLGLVGRNGSGKSTIVKLITGLESMEEGQRFVKKDTTIGYLAQLPAEEDGTVSQYLFNSFAILRSLQEEMAALEEQMQDPNTMERAIKLYGEKQEAFHRLGGYEMESNVEKVARGLNIHKHLDQTFDQLSGGERTKAGLARILLEEPDLLLLDEPTNHLDIDAIEWLEDYINQYAGAVCIISHDRHFLDQTASRIADLEQGEIEIYNGNYSSYVKQKEEKLLAEFKEYKEQQKKIKKMKEAIKRLRQWANEANPPSEKLFRKAKSMEKALEKMEKMEKPLLDVKQMGLSLGGEKRSGNDVFLAENVEKRYEDKVILRDVTLHVQYQNRIAIVGKNGAGKSTLLQLLLQQDEPTRGSLKRGTQLKVGYLPQEALQEVDPGLRVIDYFREQVIVTEGQARRILAAFMFYGYAVFRKIHQLSGGERMRLKLAVFMYQEVNVLILDEPTNHLDIESQEVLEDALKQFNGTILCVSHDRYFLNTCFAETAYIVNGELHRFPGSYEETKHKVEGFYAVEDPPKDRKPTDKKVQPEKQQEAGWEARIEQLEAEREKRQKEMESLETVEELMEAQREIDELEHELESLYEQWLT
ncbi:ribosomal protection-like ABC-F family protein [Pontibacillus salicampi]|uniref:Ribosomal protection-like ABC-F family protein n=1 Tax=Pontibacillus salicampi TaxID=1449801 RepID=A0ABV6LMU3_9BACI